MDQESIVYGFIKGVSPEGNDELLNRAHAINRSVMKTLPSHDDLVLLSRDMFAVLDDPGAASRRHSEVLHFGASYVGVEYEWDTWLAEFEAMLRQMYWVSATVHLETELAGVHTFTWESRRNFHEPGSGDMYVRCSWQQEGAIC